MAKQKELKPSRKNWGFNEFDNFTEDSIIIGTMKPLSSNILGENLSSDIKVVAIVVVIR